jgi:UPF0755 protein
VTRESNFVSSVFVGVALALIVGGAGWVIYSSPATVSRAGVQLSPRAGGDPVLIRVEEGDTATEIGRRLQAAGVIESAGSFGLLAELTDSAANLAAGEYEFNRGTSVVDALVRIRDGLTASRIVAIPEGMRLEEIAALLEKRNVVRASDFLAAANNLATTGNSIDSDLLAGRPASTSLEGYFYPATFSFARSLSANEVVQTMVKALSDRLTPQLREAARQQGLTTHQVLTLASIVEREAVLPEEMPTIASVFRNRLRLEMPLQADPTVQYAITARPGSVIEHGYWKRDLTVQDLQFESTYNTYARKGLPPGPIANPGIASIRAVIQPAATNFLYFVARDDGSHAFAATFEEHERNVQQYAR